MTGRQRYSGVYVASANAQSVPTSAVCLIWAQALTNTQLEIIRCVVGPAEGVAPVDEVLPIAMWITSAGPGGSIIVELKLQGEDDASNNSITRSLGDPGGGASTYVWYDAYHLAKGWVFEPEPEERPRVRGSTGNDVIGFDLPVNPQSAFTCSVSLVYGEIEA